MTQNEIPSRTRLLLAGKKLFSESGYEATSTASIARLAGTSESQLIKHFSGKAGLLDTIFSEGWASVTAELQKHLPQELSARERIRRIPTLMFEVLKQDPELRQLMLLEGRRIRKEGRTMTVTDGFVGLVDLIDSTLEEMSSLGQLNTTIQRQSVTSAMVGLTESALRDQVLAERAGIPSVFSVEDVGKLLEALMSTVTVQTATP